jgi:hypothetical protein
MTLRVDEVSVGTAKASKSKAEEKNQKSRSEKIISI